MTSVPSKVVLEKEMIIDPEEEEEEEEEVLMFVEFMDFLDKQIYDAKENIEIHLSDLQTKNPTASIDGIQMTGQHEINLGTMLLFQERESVDAGHSVTYLGTSNNLLKFSVTNIPDPEISSQQTSSKTVKSFPPFVPKKLS